MNNELKAIFARRSIRSYEDKCISEETVKDILEAAMAAPSAVGKDPWDFITVTKRETLKKITEELPNGQMLADAPLGIVVCGNINKAHGNELSYMLQDCSAAIENILIACSMLELGACWLGVHPRENRIEHIKKLFNLPENIIPVSAIAIGYPMEEKNSRTRYNKDSVHIEKW